MSERSSGGRGRIEFVTDRGSPVIWWCKLQSKFVGNSSECESCLYGDRCTPLSNVHRALDRGRILETRY